MHKSSPSSLELLELHDNEAQMVGLRLSFEEPLSPFVSVYPEQVLDKLKSIIRGNKCEQLIERKYINVFDEAKMNYKTKQGITS